MDMELRLLPRAEVRAVEAGHQKRLIGYAARYGVRSHLIGNKFREVIQRGAFDRVVEQDTVALVNHNANMPLGRTTAGTLRLKADALGLAYELDLGNQTYAKDLYESVQRGDINGCSFAFQLNKGVDDSWDFDDDSMPLRTIRNFRQLGDISFCTHPAYPDTVVSARALFELMAAEVRSTDTAHLSPLERAVAKRSGLDPNDPNDRETFLELVAAVKNGRRAYRSFVVKQRRDQINDILLS